jgi:hypothetical protein
MYLTAENIDTVIGWIDGVRGRGAAARKETNIGGNWVAEGIFTPAMPPIVPGKPGPTPTINHVVPAQFGHWIIRGVLDEFYPCSVEVFDERYRKAAE